jgi:hypothetical protein
VLQTTIKIEQLQGIYIHAPHTLPTISRIPFDLQSSTLQLIIGKLST